MRTISGNLKNFTSDYQNKEINFILCNTYSQKINNSDINYEAPTEITVQTDEAGDFEISLYETKNTDIKMFYKMAIKDSSKKELKVFVEDEVLDTDILKLLEPMPKLNMFYEIKNTNIIWDDTIEELFNQFFIDEDIFTNIDENLLLNEYLKYADNKRNSKTMKKLDNYLGGL